MRKINSSAFTFVIFLFSVISNTSSYALDPSAHITGNYAGVIVVKNLPQPVFFNVDKLLLGEESGKILYSRPRRCKDTLEYGGRVGDKHIFYAAYLSCDHLQDKGDVHFSATRSADAGLVVDVVGSTSGLIESFTVYPE
jgi:hypothetical protein